jgi:Fic family protein
MPYIYEQENWPNFSWDQGKISPCLSEIWYTQGRQYGKLESLGMDMQSEAHLASLTDEIVKSSEIEGETLEAKSVRSSIAKRLGLNTAGLPLPTKNIEGFVSLILDATNNYTKVLSPERLFNWHSLLFEHSEKMLISIDVGQYRSDAHGLMQVVSGGYGKEKVHYQAPPASDISREMEKFIVWYNNSKEDEVLKSAIAHLWFVTIHPFDDGNGRITRAISEMTLARSQNSTQRYYSVSNQIMKERKQYYRQLQLAQAGSLDITAWLSWYLGCVSRAIQTAENSINKVLSDASTWKQIHTKGVNERQSIVLARLLGDFKGNLTNDKYVKLAKCSPNSALRDIRDLLAKGLLSKNEGAGRSTSYRLRKIRE